MNNIPACLLDGNLLSLAAYLPMLVYSLTSISCFNADGSIRRLIFRSVSVVILLPALLTILSCIAPGHTRIQAGLISLLLVYVFQSGGNQFWISEIAYFLPQPGLAMMIVARILDRESRFAKVLMWLYIVLLGLTGLILLAAIIFGIALFASCAGSGGYWM